MKQFVFIILAMLFSGKKETAKTNLIPVVHQEMPVISIKNSNCITLKSKAGKQVFENCYEVDFIEIRKQTGNYLPLTFISGKKAIDADFYPVAGKWVATRVTYFDPGINNGKGKKVDFKANLSDFDFNAVVEKAIESK